MDDWDDLQAQRDEIETEIARLRRRITEIDNAMYAIEQRELQRDYQEGRL